MRRLLALVCLVLAAALSVLPASGSAEDAVPPPTQPRTDGESVVWEQAGAIYVSQRDPWKPDELVRGLNLQWPPSDITPDIDGDIVAWTGGEGCRGCGGQTVQVLDRATNQTFIAGGLAQNAPPPRVSNGYVFWIGNSLSASADPVFQPQSIFIANVRSPEPAPTELRSVNGGMLHRLAVNGDRFCWLEQGSVFTASVGDLTPRQIYTSQTGSQTCSLAETVAVITSETGNDEDLSAAIETVNLITGETRVIAADVNGVTANDNGYAFWVAGDPRRLRGYDPVADRIFQLNATDSRADPHAEDGVMVWIQGTSVAVRQITDLEDARDPNWWQRRRSDLIVSLVLAALISGGLLLLAGIPGLAATTPARGIGVVTLLEDEPPGIAVRWAGLAGIVGGVLTIGTGVFAAVRPFAWNAEFSEDFEPSISFHERLVLTSVLLLLVVVVSGLQARQHTRAGATGWVGYALTLLGVGLLVATALELRDGWGGVLLGALLLGVGLMTLGSATIDAEAPVRWRPTALLIGLITLVALPALAFSGGGSGSIFAISPFLFAIGIVCIMLGYSVATVRPADLDG